MTDIIISQKESGNETPKKNMEEEVVDALKASMELQKIEQGNERLRKALNEKQELEAKLALGGRAFAGQPIETEEQKRQREVKEEAERLVKAFR